MIKLESIHVEEVRGIRKLDLEFGKKTLAIHGPNGSGKSGIIDAIEFGLTGQMGRLMGEGHEGSFRRSARAACGQSEISRCGFRGAKGVSYGPEQICHDHPDGFIAKEI